MGLNNELLHPKSMAESETDHYNNMAMMNDWVSELLGQQSLKLEMIALETEYISALKEYYGTAYFCFTGVNSLNFGQGRNPMYYAHSLSNSKRLPRRFTTLHFFLFDIESGEPMWFLNKGIGRLPREFKINSLLFDIIYQLKNKGKK